MARAIDGELLELEIANIANKLAKSDAQKALMGRVMYCVEHMPTLTPPNEWVNRVRELDELYTKLQIVTGFTAEQLLEIFAAGYTLEKPDYSKKFAEMENLAEAAQPNEPLTWNELGNMVGKPVYIVELEDGESSLEETFAGYEAGMKLVRSLSSQIDKVEKQIQILSEGEDNE